MTDLQRLAAVVPTEFIKDPPQGRHGKYVGHADINQIALMLVGPHDFLVTEVVRGFIPEWTQRDGNKTNPERPHGIVGVLATLTVDLDGRRVVVQEAGDANSPDVHSDGENMKTATSDAYKRCWMRTGLGLHLWVTQGQNPSRYLLPDQLAKDAGEDETPTADYADKAVAADVTEAMEDSVPHDERPF